MSGNRPMTDFPRNEAGLVDNFIGTAYDVVKGVYDALPEIRELHEIVEEIPGMGVAAVEAAMVPARVEILGYVDRAEDAAEAAEAAANDAKKANVMYPFTFNVAQAEYDVTVIAGRSDVTTSGLALWVEGAIEYDFTITSPTKFIINSMLEYPNGAQMGVILNARFDNIIKNFDDLADAFTVAFNSAQAVRALEFSEFLQNSGLEVPVPYVTGMTLTRPSQTVNYLGDDYRVNPIYLPLTTTTWATDSPKMVMIGNDALREDLLGGPGSSLVAQHQPVGPTMTVADYLLRNKLICLSGDLLQQFIDYASATGGGRDVTLIPTVYNLDSLTMKSGVDLGVVGGYALSVQHLLGAGTPKGMPILRCGPISNDFITVPSTAFVNSIKGVVIDARQQVAGKALVHSDAAGVQRTGSWVENVMIWKRGTGSGWEIAANHKEGGFSRVFVRCSEDGTNGIGGPDTGAGEYGFVCHSIDWTGDRLWTGFAKTRNILYDGGACRFSNVDAWGCQDINAEVGGSSSTWLRLQTDSGGNSGLKINAAQNAVFDNYISIGNAKTVAADDVVFSGAFGGVTFKSPQMRGSPSINMGYAFGMEDTARGLPAISNHVVATSYLAPFNDRCLAYGDIHGGMFLNRPIRGNASLPVELNTNPLFGYFSAGVPVDWPIRNNGVPSQLTADVDLPSDGYYVTALRIVSGTTGTSGNHFVVPNPEKYQGRILVIKAIMKGDGLSAPNNQRLHVFDNNLTAGEIEMVPNDGSYGPIATVYRVPLGVTLIQIRLIAANDTTPGLKLDVTDVSIRVI